MNAIRRRVSCFRLVVVLAAAGATVPSALAAADGQPPVFTLASPLTVSDAPADASVTPLTLDTDVYVQLKSRDRFLMQRFPLPANERIDLELKRVEVFAPGAMLVVATATGEQPLPRPDVVVLSGRVAGDPDSTVFLSLSPSGTRGFIETGPDRFVISSGPFAQRNQTAIYDYNAAAPETFLWLPWRCDIDRLPNGGAVPQGGAFGGGSGAVGGSGVAVYSALIAVETDFEFTNNLFGGDLAAAEAYVATLIGAASEIYVRDVGAQLSVSFLRLWSTSADPWTRSDTSAQLVQFRGYWNANMGHVFRHVTHFLSGRSLGGGIAYLSTVCMTGWNYGLSANLAGFFPFPLQDNHSANWDIVVVAHELGHNFGTPHTHDLTPPIDRCAFGDCSVVPNGTIMSYCHLCSGGMANIKLHFHPRIISEEIAPFLAFEVGCNLSAGPATVFAQPESVSTCDGGIAELTVGAAGTAPIDLQWRKDGVAIPGATSSFLEIDPATAAAAGVYDVIVSNAEGSTVSDAASLSLVECPPPTAEALGCRAISIVPPVPDITTSIAFEVSSPDWPCFSKYLDTNGELADGPVFRFVDEWNEARLVGADVIPSTVYDVRMNFGTAASPRFTVPVTVETGVWGDTAGVFIDGAWTAPDGQVDIVDALADLDCFINAPGAPPRAVCDISPATPDASIDILDVLHVLNAFTGVPYPFATPCP